MERKGGLTGVSCVPEIERIDRNDRVSARENRAVKVCTQVDVEQTSRARSKKYALVSVSAEASQQLFVARSGGSEGWIWETTPTIMARPGGSVGLDLGIFSHFQAIHNQARYFCSPASLESGGDTLSDLLPVKHP